MLAHGDWPCRRPGGQLLITSGLWEDRLGGCARTRTVDPLIKSQLLYHLSYAPWAEAGHYQGDPGLSSTDCQLSCKAQSA